MSEEDPSRLDNEIELLTAIYPEQASYSSKSRELKFIQEHAALQLRIPETYPETGLPDVLGATDTARNDIRDQTKAAVRALHLPEGEETLDAILSAFQQVLSDRLETSSIASAKSAKSTKSIKATKHEDSHSQKTVIIWLHHLLNTNKRKLCLSPAFSGITKPGYPGVLVYSGPAAAVSAHVSELKAQNWAAFQVRFEEDVRWQFAHGEGVREVESMADVVKSLEFDEKLASSQTAHKGGKKAGIADGMGSKQREDFLKAVGIK
ncbi:uncharacterized protein EKO05_0004508 [Ascochyta rabiei]|uniref:Uncharacterized protein n=1 Tax=Didymella rabiei TaxID=5454 RepID=A0A163DQ64_DIDRA|nr:uncharacterized protein EKO05_0004508 [Ascochyta rabiei]KZM23299.1 hypothetical protein ST47_g5544 [Ascochyta rabiei]UPX14015.1 hypothetical protein EKO05_0004508 [Ascochyta rabiei]